MVRDQPHPVLREFRRNSGCQRIPDIDEVENIISKVGGLHSAPFRAGVDGPELPDFPAAEKPASSENRNLDLGLPNRIVS
jgi:hypothetical protein